MKAQKLDQREIFLRDAVWNGFLSLDEAKMIRTKRESKLHKVVFVSCDKEVPEMCPERRDALVEAIKRKTGATEVAFLPPGYTIHE